MRVNSERAHPQDAISATYQMAQPLKAAHTDIEWLVHRSKSGHTARVVTVTDDEVFGHNEFRLSAGFLHKAADETEKFRLNGSLAGFVSRRFKKREC